MVNAMIGQKRLQTQKFLQDGRRIPVTEIWCGLNPVVSVKDSAKAGYSALQVGLGTKKHPSKALEGHIKGAALKSAPQFLREIRVVASDDSLPKVGDALVPNLVFKPGDIVDVIGISKGKGWAGAVKRHHFKGGPRTHGQSDRERAPGSIGQTTTPGRVYKGKRMAGHMGSVQTTVKNLEVVGVFDDVIWVKGLVPGGKNNMLVIRKIGEGKKFVPLIEESKETPAEETVQAVESSVQPTEENVSANAPQQSQEEPKEVKPEEKPSEKEVEAASVEEKKQAPAEEKPVEETEPVKEDAKNAGK